MSAFILYKSRALLQHDINNQTIGIAKASLSNNRRDGITGFLHVENAAFYQYIEGGQSEVEALFNKIQHDPRHMTVTLVASGNSDRRLFGDFDMGFSSAHGRKISNSFSEDPNNPPAKCIIQFLKEVRGEISTA